MKRILALLCLLFASEAHAFNYDLTCATEPLTTTFGIWNKGDEMVVRVIHQLGARYAPAFNGIFTPNDIPYLADVAKLVMKMPTITTFHWPMKNCGLKGEVLKCFGSDDVQEGEGGAKLRPFAVHTSTSAEETIAGHNEYITISLSFDVDDKSGSRIEMKYPKDQCSKGLINK